MATNSTSIGPPGQRLLAHLEAAWNLARWLTLDDHDAHDVVQEAFLRALRFEGGPIADARAWLLTIVRNTCYTWLAKNKRDLGLSWDDDAPDLAAADSDPGGALIQCEDREQLRAALGHLPPIFREAIVLRELEGLSYKQISDVAGISIGTVMSRLSRGRRELKRALAKEFM